VKSEAQAVLRQDPLHAAGAAAAAKADASPGREHKKRSRHGKDKRKKHRRHEDDPLQPQAPDTGGATGNGKGSGGADSNGLADAPAGNSLAAPVGSAPAPQVQGPGLRAGPEGRVQRADAIGMQGTSPEPRQRWRQEVKYEPAMPPVQQSMELTAERRMRDDTGPYRTTAVSALRDGADTHSERDLPPDDLRRLIERRRARMQEEASQDGAARFVGRAGRVRSFLAICVLRAAVIASCLLCIGLCTTVIVKYPPRS
jgi:hypothetical protein